MLLLAASRWRDALRRRLFGALAPSGRHLTRHPQEKHLIAGRLKQLSGDESSPITELRHAEVLEVPCHDVVYCLKSLAERK